MRHQLISMAVVCLAIVIIPITLARASRPSDPTQPYKQKSPPTEQLTDQLTPIRLQQAAPIALPNLGSTTDSAVASASEISNQISAQEWLGPLAGVAVSPFFGLACLSGIATYGPESIQSRSALFGPKSPLHNPWLFWTMAILTVVTSLPRFSKVSKPLGLAIEKLEAYSAIIILISMKMLSGLATSSDTIALGNETIVMAGFVQSSTDLMLSIASALNVIVINTIKLLIELMVWVIPIPFVDACLEIANKSICASMVALYTYSPVLATSCNLCLLTICGMIFFRARRRMNYIKEIMVKPVLAKLFSLFKADRSQFVGFLVESSQGLPVRTAIYCSAGTDSNWNLETRSWLHRRAFTGTIDERECQSGFPADQIAFKLSQGSLRVSVRKDLSLVNAKQIAVAH
jgi:hypothetical protein